MSEHTGNWYPVGPIQWDAQGNPYQNTSDGMKSYIPPIAAAQYQNDPKMLAWAKAHGANVTYGPKDANGNPTTSDVRTGAPEGGFAGNYHWNGETGGYEKDNFFDSSLGGLVLGGSALAAPFALSALGVGAPAAAAPAAGVEAGEGGLGLVGATAPAAASVPAAAATTTAAAVPSVAKILTGLAPLGATITSRLANPSPSGSGVSAIDPTLLSRLSQMLDLAQQRATSAQPVHDAAMQMAMRMAPTYGTSPRLNDAITNSTNPLPSGNPSAAMLAAYQKLAGR